MVNELKEYHDVIKWKYFPCYWPLVRESTGHRWNPHPYPLTPLKVNDAELVLFDMRLNNPMDVAQVWYMIWNMHLVSLQFVRYDLLCYVH